VPTSSTDARVATSAAILAGVVTPLGTLGRWRHVVVGASVAAIGAATLAGLIGEDRSERYDAKQIVVAPAGADGLRVTEVVDVDFGRHDRHGYERVIPTDFGVVTDVSASSPDAPDDVDIAALGSDTRIRVGNPDVTVTGRHRYVLDYTYPATTLDDGELALDLVAPGERLETRRFEIVVTGLELADPQCNVGGEGTVGGCELVDDGDVYRAVVEPLDAGDGVTIGGTVIGRREVVDVEAPPFPAPGADRRLPLAVATTAVGALTGAGIYAIARRRGRNEVFSGGAADAAFGPPLPAPNATVGAVPPPPAATANAAARPLDPPWTQQIAGTQLVADEQMDELATIEFVPPAGVEPWVGQVLLTERVTNDTVAAWISGAAAHDVLALSKDGEGDTVLARGPNYAHADPADRRVIDTMLAGDSALTLGTYSKPFATAWSEILRRQRATIAASGYWRRALPRAAIPGALGVWAVIVVFFGIRVFVSGDVLDWLQHPAAAVTLAVLAPGLAAAGVYSTLLPRRTAHGSALTLRTESFRRFLAASEGQHVEWAWRRGLLREYSAWAVALGAADTWERALQTSKVPPAELSSGPLVVWTSAGAFRGAHTAPSSSGGSGGSGGFGGGGFSGGSVGGGGGGGSSGSW
jgi:uncharacterized membrane protein YgcG